MAKTSVRMIKSPESKDEEFEQLQLRTKDQADSILNMFGTSTEKLIPRAKEPVYKTKFENGGAVGPDVASLRPSETSMGLAPYGVRHSGEGLKGKGYFGEIQSPSGQSVTEYSLYDEDIGEYPSIVPTLTAEELQDTIRRSSQGEHPSVEVIMKARMYAKDRLSDGKSTFSGPTELRFPVPSNTDDDMIRRIDAYLEKTADGVRTTPITGADEVIQIGKLVLARKPKLQSWDDYYKTASFEGGGEVGEGIGSLSLDNRYREAKVFDLDYVEDAERYNSREELEQLNPSFMVGRYKIRPNISGSYQMSSVDIPQNIDGKQLLLKQKYKKGDGNLGFNVTTPNRHGFGANVSGNYFTGSTENPEELQAFGAPAKVNYGEGFLPQQYNAYYRTPEGLTISGNYREENPDQEREYGIMLSKQIEFQNVKDLTDRIARLLEKNRP
jgi:hypothetical protein